MTVEDILEAQKRLNDLRENHERLRASFEKLHEKKLAEARTPEEVEKENKQHAERTQKPEQEFKQNERQALADVERMKATTPSNDNLHVVGEGQAPSVPPQQYAATATVGVPQYGGLPVGKTANDNDPTKGPPGGGGSGSDKPGESQGATQAPGLAGDTSDQPKLDGKVKSDFSAPLPPPPPPPANDNQRKLAL